MREKMRQISKRDERKSGYSIRGKLSISRNRLLFFIHPKTIIRLFFMGERYY